LKKFSHKIKRYAQDYLDVPNDIAFDLPRITVIGFYQVYIENYKNVVQFTNEYLHLRLTNKEIKIIGEKLVIRKIWTDEILIEGLIKEIRLI